MGVLLAFAVGYTVGARAGTRGFDDVVASLRALRESDEFAEVLSAVRSHAGYVLKEMAEILSNEGEPLAMADLVERVRGMGRGSEPTWNGS